MTTYTTQQPASPNWSTAPPHHHSGQPARQLDRQPNRSRNRPLARTWRLTIVNDADDDNPHGLSWWLSSPD